MAKGRTWFRVERDWFSDGAILELARTTGATGVVAWFRLLGRACLCEGEFSGELVNELADLNLGIDRDAAKSIGRQLISLGLVTSLESGFVIRSWATYQPPMRYTTPNARITGVVTDARKGVTTYERTNERTNERTDQPTKVGNIIRGGFHG